MSFLACARSCCSAVEPDGAEVVAGEGPEPAGEGGAVAGVVAAVAGMDLERASYSVLFRLEEGPARLSDLAQRVGVDISTLSRQVHHLEAAGLVGRSVMEEDRRAALLSVTDEGRDFVHRIRAAKRAAITEMLEHWTPEERAELGRVLGP